MTAPTNKRRFFLLALTLALCLTLMAGCAHDPADKPASKFPHEPPLLSVSADETTVYAWRGTYSWEVKSLFGGTGTGIQSDSPHPLDCIDKLATLPLSTDATITLTFEAPPSEILVRRYKLTASDYDDCEEIEIKGDSFKAEDGNYLYEVIAKWDSPLKSYSGSAYYAFRTGT